MPSTPTPRSRYLYSLRYLTTGSRLNFFDFMDAVWYKLKHYFAPDFSPDMEELNGIMNGKSCELIEELEVFQSDALKKVHIKKYLKKVSDLYKQIENFPDFRSGLDWLNTKQPLSIRNHLSGKLVLLDFFTYCCINCMHIIPDLKKLEEEFSVEDGLVVIGVHNAKFTNETVTENIKSAVMRYGISHAVVNESIEGMWSSFGVSCWPTQVILGPQGEPLFSVAGEGHAATIRLFVETCLEHFTEAGTLSRLPVEVLCFSSEIEERSWTRKVPGLRFPGKIAFSPNGDFVAIADTGNHRILIAESDFSVTAIAGGNSGFQDGGFEDAQFNAPQGLCFVGEETIYVADTENHAIREINFVMRTVTTVAGTGLQGCDKKGGKSGREQPLSSPWDVLYLPKEKILLIAMAGLHQLWAFALKDTNLFGEEIEQGVCVRVVGSGAEENRNGTYRHRVGLAQPSGLSLGDGFVYFADSESSAVRSVSLESGAVTLVGGGAIDPKNLFAYGDLDGVGTAAKLQHPLDVAWHNGNIYVADSYNHKLKVINAKTHKCTTIDPSLYKLNEPGGLSCHGDLLFIADTNNHSIKVVNLTNQIVKEVKIKTADGQSLKHLGEKSPSSQQQIKAPPAKRNSSVDGEWTIEVMPGGKAKIKVTIERLNAFNASAPIWQLYHPANEACGEPVEGWTVEWIVECRDKSSCAVLQGRLTECCEDKCYLHQIEHHVHVVPNASGPKDNEIVVSHKIKPKSS